MKVRFHFLFVGLVALGLSACTPSKAAEVDPQQTAETSSVSVILFADPGEADASCGCGEVIRAVRGAGKRGVPYRELAPDQNPPEAKTYRVVVAPTVLLLDSQGKETTRFEGESQETITALKAALEKVPAKKS